MLIRRSVWRHKHSRLIPVFLVVFILVLGLVAVERPLAALERIGGPSESSLRSKAVNLLVRTGLAPAWWSDDGATSPRSAGAQSASVLTVPEAPARPATQNVSPEAEARDRRMNVMVRAMMSADESPVAGDSVATQSAGVPTVVTTPPSEERSSEPISAGNADDRSVARPESAPELLALPSAERPIDPYSRLLSSAPRGAPKLND